MRFCCKITTEDKKTGKQVVTNSWMTFEKDIITTGGDMPAAWGPGAIFHVNLGDKWFLINHASDRLVLIEDKEPF